MYIRLEATPGQHIEDAALEAFMVFHMLDHKEQQDTYFTFNGLSFRLRDFSTSEGVAREYFRRTNKPRP